MELMIRVENLVVVTESEKAYGVIPSEEVLKSVSVETITHISQLKPIMDPLIRWIAKSKSGNPAYQHSDIFPKLSVRYPCKVNPSVISYKTMMSLDIEKWLAKEKKLIPNEEEGVLTESQPENSLW
jgi:hypothetical protein